MDVRKKFSTGLFSLCFVNIFHQDTLVFEDVTLGFHVKFMVPMFVMVRFACFLCNGEICCNELQIAIALTNACQSFHFLCIYGGDDEGHAYDASK